MYGKKSSMIGCYLFEWMNASLLENKMASNPHMIHCKKFLSFAILKKNLKNKAKMDLGMYNCLMLSLKKVSHVHFIANICFILFVSNNTVWTFEFFSTEKVLLIQKILCYRNDCAVTWELWINTESRRVIFQFNYRIL